MLFEKERRMECAMNLECSVLNEEGRNYKGLNLMIVLSWFSRASRILVDVTRYFVPCQRINASESTQNPTNSVPRASTVEPEIERDGIPREMNDKRVVLDIC